MPGRAGRIINGVPSLAVTGLQRNVIEMAFCCKKGGGQSIMGETATAKATQQLHWHYGYHGPKRDLVVVAGADLRLG